MDIEFGAIASVMLVCLFWAAAGLALYRALRLRQAVYSTSLLALALVVFIWVWCNNDTRQHWRFAEAVAVCLLAGASLSFALLKRGDGRSPTMIASSALLTLSIVELIHA